MADNILTAFKAIILLQLFFGTSITIISHALPDSSLNYVTSMSDLGNSIGSEDVTSEVQSSIESQLNIPIIELGALVFYSGNILLDLIVNFLFAIPQMIILLFQGLAILFNIDAYFMGTIQAFITGAIGVMYFIGLIQLLINVRSQGAVI